MKDRTLLRLTGDADPEFVADPAADSLRLPDQGRAGAAEEHAAADRAEQRHDLVDRPDAV
ncbi:hypothetical protein ACFY8X_26510 [Streptomyces tanashiensis]|uniref:hypothetical protein n=1 Tax=Streptomyces tanashiensis TaxID=67367 RepID=UPI0036E9A001